MLSRSGEGFVVTSHRHRDEADGDGARFGCSHIQYASRVSLYRQILPFFAMAPDVYELEMNGVHSRLLKCTYGESLIRDRSRVSETAGRSINGILAALVGLVGV